MSDLKIPKIAVVRVINVEQRWPILSAKAKTLSDFASITSEQFKEFKCFYACFFL